MSATDSSMAAIYGVARIRFSARIESKFHRILMSELPPDAIRLTVLAATGVVYGSLETGIGVPTANIEGKECLVSSIYNDNVPGDYYVQVPINSTIVLIYSIDVPVLRERVFLLATRVGRSNSAIYRLSNAFSTYFHFRSDWLSARLAVVPDRRNGDVQMHYEALTQSAMLYPSDATDFPDRLLQAIRQGIVMGYNEVMTGEMTVLREKFGVVRVGDTGVNMGILGGKVVTLSEVDEEIARATEGKERLDDGAVWEQDRRLEELAKKYDDFVKKGGDVF